MLSATSRGSRPPYKETKGVFGRVGFREDEKKNLRENFLECLFGRGEREKKWWVLGPTKKFSSQNGE